LPHAIESGLICLNENPDSGMAYGAFHLIDADGQLIRSLKLRKFRENPFKEMLSGNLIGMHGTVMYRKHCLQEIGGFDSSLRACEDFDLYLRFSRKFPISCHDDYVAEYRMHSANMSHNSALMLDAALKVLEKHRRYVKSHPDLQLAFRNAVASWKKHYSNKLAIKIIQTQGWTYDQLREFMWMLKLSPIGQLKALVKVFSNS
jgi:hypothetical protein